MAHYGDNSYDPYAQPPDAASHQQQHLQHQHTGQDGLGTDMYSSQLFSDPRYQMPPNFLDDPPRGPDPMSSLGGRDNQYFAPPQLQQDPGWANYLMPTGQTSPMQYTPTGAPSNSQYYYPGTFSNGQQPQYSFTNSVEPVTDELSNFPTMSLEPHRSPILNLNQMNAQSDGAGPSQPRGPPEPAARMDEAVIASPGQPSPFGPLFYSSSGFDMIGILTRVANRKNPQVVLGPVDFTCSFVVSDALAPDEPIVYASPTFSELTGYEMSEIVGKNCRFLQAPSGRVRKGESRRFTDDKGVAHIRKSIDNTQECQVSFINYKKSGEAFVNLVTIIPISWDDTDDIRYLIGFQVDLEKQPGAILRMMNDGSYAVNYSTSADPTPPMSDKLKTILGLGDGADEARQKFNNFILKESDDFIHVVSLKGAFQYVSPSVTAVLEYAPEELLGKSISDIAHPSDVVPIMRELKESTTQVQPPSLISSASLAQHYLSQAKLVHLLYRVRRRDSGYVWLESTGRLHVESSKGRKSIVFSGRLRKTPVLPWSLLAQESGNTPSALDGDIDCWAQVAVDNGLLLYVSSGAQTLFGRPAREVQGTAIRDWVATGWQVAVDAALSEARKKLEDTLGHDATGGSLTSITCTRAIPERNSTTSPLITITFYSPDHQITSPAMPSASAMQSPSGSSPASAHGSTRSRGSSHSNSKSPPVLSVPPQPTPPPGGVKRGVRHSTIICHVRFPPPSTPPVEPNVQDYLRPPGFTAASTSASTSTSTPNIPPPPGSGPHSAASSGSATLDESNPSPRSTGKTTSRLVSASLNANIFEELETTRGTSWQYELQQLRMANARIQAEIDEALKQRRKG